jgi:hypothetical protein
MENMHMSEFSDLLEEYAAVAVFIDNKEAEIAEIKKVRDKIKAAVQAQMCSIGITNARSVEGHAVTLVTNVSAKVADADAFWDFVFGSPEGGDTFLQKRVNNDAVKEYVDAHNGECPPGVTMETVNSLRFTKAKIK